MTLRSHPEPEARDSSWKELFTHEARARSPEEQPRKWWLCRPRRAQRSYPTLKVRKVVVRRYPSSKVRSSGYALLEQL